MHRAVGVVLAFIAIRAMRQPPGVGEKLAVVDARIRFQTLLEQSRDGGFAGANRAVQKENALFGAIPLRRRLEEVDELHQWALKPVDGVGASVHRIAEKAVSRVILLEER